MKNKINFTLLIIVLVAVLTQSCKKEEAIEPVATNITYSKDIQPLMTNYCLTCHSSIAPESGLILDNYADVKASGESGKLVSRTNDSNNPMPTNGLMSAEKRQKIKDWVAGGYKE